MTKPITVTIQGVKHDLKFGYGVLRRLSEELGFDSFDDLGKHIDALKLANGKLSFAALNFIGQLVKASIEYGHGTKTSSFDADEIVDEVVFKNPELVTAIILAFFDSFPKGNDQGKPKPATSRTKKK